MQYERFPHVIRRTVKLSGRGEWPFGSQGLHELVIDELGRAWAACNGHLISLVRDGSMPVYADPRTKFEAAALGDDTTAWTTAWGWLDEVGNVVERHLGDEADPLVDIPPDRRDEWKQFLEIC